jgi:hypothetical protein
MSVIFKLSHKARVFVRLGWKSLSSTDPMLNTKICKLQTKKFKTSAHWVGVIKQFVSATYEYL